MKSENLISRSPVVVIMGHIDHGKSTLLDYIRKTNVVGGEAGGITQHLGAYEVNHEKGKITFLDTPGHEAFCGIRERGAKVADVAVLVVSAEDGVKPQTLEALKCILSEKIPYIVAINKIDKPGANIEITKQSLAENEIYVEGYGGDISVVNISALNGIGVSDLLNMIVLVSELQDLKGNPSIPAEGTIIESYRDNKKGISATLLIKDGVLESNMYIVSHNVISKARMLENYQGKLIKSASFSSPVKVTGFSEIPIVGANFKAYRNKKDAEKMAESYKSNNKIDSAVKDDAGVVIIPIIIKADVVGSLDGIKHELKKIKNDKVKIKIVSESIGDINENDVKSAQGDANIVILGFNSKADAKTASLIERSDIKVKSFDIIYNLVEAVKEMVTSKVPREYIDEISGTAKVLAIFSKNKDKQILGGKVQEGVLKMSSEIKILRRDAEIGRGKIKELQQQKKRTDEVGTGFEFGCMIESKVEIALGDKIQGFITIEKK
ncbi:MAG TPA: translation initiation factor IF-2 [Candidatus Paceibacterota bacterium]